METPGIVYEAAIRPHQTDSGLAKLLGLDADRH